MIAKDLNIDFQQNPNPMWVYNVDDLKVVNVNQSALELYGYTKDEFLNLTLEDLRPAEEVRKLREEVNKEKKSFNDAGIWLHKKKNNEPLYVRILSTPLGGKSSDKKLIVAHNITEYYQTKEKLENKTVLLEAIIQNLPGTFYVINQEGTVLKWNKNLEDITGYSEDEIANQSALKFFHKDDVPEIQKAIGKAFSEGYAELETTLCTKSGTKIPFYFSAGYSKLHGEDCVIGTGINITKQRNYQRKLEQQKLLLEAITEQSDSIIFVKDVDGPYKLVNKKFKEDLGFTSQKVIGKTDRELFKPEVAKQLIEADTKVLKIGFADHIEETVPTVDGSRTYVSVKYPLSDIPGYEKSICGIATDITELKKAEKEIEALYEREKAEKAKLELINQRLTLLSKVNTIFLETEDHEKALQEVSELLTQEVADLCSFDLLIDGDLKRIVTTHRDSDKEEIAKTIHKEHPNMFYGSDFLKQVLSENKQVFIPEVTDEILESHISDPSLEELVSKLELGSILIKPLQFKGKNVGIMTWVLSGEQKNLIENAPLLIDELSYKLALAVDNLMISNKFKSLNETLERKVLERTEMLEKANKELEAFSYSVSHDLRAPLRAIDGYSSILLEDYYKKFDEDGQQFLTTVNEEAKRMGELIDDLLSFSRMHRAEKRSSSFSMRELVEEAINEVSAGFKGVEAEITLHDLPTVEADRKMFKQVWINLINNSFKYRKKNTDPTLIIKSELDKRRSEYIFSIKDEGVGFNMKYADKLFGVFQRLHSEEEFEGTGIGLALVRRIINRHNGRTWADSKIGKGTTIYFTIPINQQE